MTVITIGQTHLCLKTIISAAKTARKTADAVYDEVLEKFPKYRIGDILQSVCIAEAVWHNTIFTRKINAAAKRPVPIQYAAFLFSESAAI